MDGQTFLFGDGGEVFRLRRFEGKKGIGKVIGLQVRLGERAIPDQQFADFRFGRVGGLGIGKIIRAELAVIGLNHFLKVGPGPFRPGLREKIRRLKRDIADLNTVGQAVGGEVIRVKLRDGGGRDRDSGQII